MEQNISDYDFVDCLFIDFCVDKTISTLFFIVEAYYPARDLSERRRKGLLKITCNQISKISLTKNEEFDFDISINYDKEGKDSKANEVFSIELKKGKSENAEIKVESDMLILEISCLIYSLQEIY